MRLLGQWLLDSMPTIVAMVALVGAASVLLAAWRIRSAGWREALSISAADGTLMVAIGLVALFTLGSAPGEQPDRLNLLPFRDQIWALQGQIDPAIALATLLANILLFMPLGLALAARSPERSNWSLVGLAFVASVAIEATQALLNAGRLADVTDVLANTAGAALGIGAWRAFVGVERRSLQARPIDDA